MTASIGVAVLIFTNLILLPIMLSYTGVSQEAAKRSLRDESEETKGKGLGKVWGFLDRFTGQRWAAGDNRRSRHTCRHWRCRWHACENRVILTPALRNSERIHVTIKMMPSLMQIMRSPAISLPSLSKRRSAKDACFTTPSLTRIALPGHFSKFPMCSRPSVCRIRSVHLPQPPMREVSSGAALFPTEKSWITPGP